MAEGKYYWLKLKRDFFKRHDIQIIEGMPNGKDYILFFLKLLCESVDHEGKLRFSDQVPYDEEMLATITHTDIAIVKSALSIFCKFGMVSIEEDGTYFISTVEKMIGFETDWARKKKEYREKVKKRLEDIEEDIAEDKIRTLSDKSKSKSKSKNILCHSYDFDALEKQLLNQHIGE